MSKSVLEEHALVAEGVGVYDLFDESYPPSPQTYNKKQGPTRMAIHLLDRAHSMGGTGKDHLWLQCAAERFLMKAVQHPKPAKPPIDFARPLHI